MAGTISLGHVTSFLQIILLIVTVIWSAEGTNSSMPCPVINERTGAMLCCPSIQPKIIRPIGRRCTAVLPKNAFPLMTESWSVEAFNIYHLNWRHEADLLRPTKRYSMCCCKEESDLILPGMAHAVSGKRRKVVQHLMGYVQPILSTTCKESSCMKIKNRRRNFFNCVQRWTTKALYIEDPVYEDFISLERIKVPSGCSCKMMPRNESVRLNMERASYESDTSNTTSGNDDSELKDYVVSKIPVSDDTADDPFDNEVAGLVGYDFNKFNLPSESEHEIPANSHQQDPYDTVEYHFNYTNSSFYQHRPIDLYNLSLSSSSSDSFQHPPSIFNDANRPETSYESFQDSYNYQNFLGGIDDGTEYESSNDFNVPPNRPEAFQIASNYYNINPGATEDAAKRQKYLSNSSTNQQPFALGSLVPSDQLSNANFPLSASHTQYANKLSSYAKKLNLSMDKYLKMGLLSGSLGKMSTSQIVENVLDKVDGTRQMQVLTMAQRLMQLEVEYLRLSMEMMDIGFRHLKSPSSGTSAPKLSFANNPAVDHIPIIFKPGVDRPTPVATSELDETNFSDVSQSIPVPPRREENLPKEDILTNEGNHNPEETSSLAKPAGNSPVSLEASSVEAEFPTPNTSRMAINMMIEDALYSAFVNFLFQQAWMNETCMVPSAIDQSNTELDFLPSLVKEKINVEAKGTLNINKFASRVIAGIIMCQIEDPEMALLDGRLARAISIGIKVAQLLNNQIRIMKEMMRGLLDTDDAETIVSLLRWSSQPADVPATELLGSSKNATNVDNLLAVVKDSLSEYVDFLKAKSSKKDDQKPPVPSNSSSSISGSTNLNADSATLTNTTKGNAVKPSALQNLTTTDKTNGIQELATTSSTSSVDLLLTEENRVEGSSLIPVRKDKPTTPLTFNSLASSPVTIVPINTTTDKGLISYFGVNNSSGSQNIETSTGTSPTIPVVIKTMDNRTTIVDHESLNPTTIGPKIPVGDLKDETNATIFALAGKITTESIGTVKTTMRESAGFQTLAKPDAITTTKNQNETQDKFIISTMQSVDNEGSDIKPLTTTKVPYSTKGQPALSIINLIGMTVDLTAITSENAINRATEKSTDIPGDTEDYIHYDDYEYNDYGYEDEILKGDGYGPDGTNWNHGSKGDEYGGYGSNDGGYGHKGDKYGNHGSKGGEYGGYGHKGDKHGNHGSKGDEYGGYGSKGDEYGGYGSKGDKYGNHGSKGDEYGGYGSKGDKYGNHGSKGDEYGGYSSNDEYGGYGPKGDKYGNHGSKGDEYGGYGSKGDKYGNHGSKGDEYGGYSSNDEYGGYGPKGDKYGNHGSKGDEYGGYGSKGDKYGNHGSKGDEYGGYGSNEDEYGGYGPKGDKYGTHGSKGDEYGGYGFKGDKYGNQGGYGSKGDKYGNHGFEGDEYGGYGSKGDKYGYHGPKDDKYGNHGSKVDEYGGYGPKDDELGGYGPKRDEYEDNDYNGNKPGDNGSNGYEYENYDDEYGDNGSGDYEYGYYGSDRDNSFNGNGYGDEAIDYVVKGEENVGSSDISHENSVDVSSSDINHENSVDVSSSDINDENSVDVSSSDINHENSVDVGSSDINDENSVDVGSSDINDENSVDVGSSDINDENSVDVGSSDINHENSVDVSSLDINHENSVDVSSSNINHENSVDVSSLDINHENSVDVSSSDINLENSVEIIIFPDDKEMDPYLINDLPGEYGPLHFPLGGLKKLLFPNLE